ncbi:NADPH:quinone oxidoreductase family protein [Phycicoccus sp.]|uniref:NADPH:quinone oxidoreductase family protein n=1 Tax=Phycicoccus sp. TaxID=1902410 RepID=UPI002BB2E3DA|nr:NADPH:quinone oxidoreductase family protein [Phycicoccus sp.]HRV57742.1 NADPH:quinone oxidoreductase family protein [Phycicoccus sp.]
MRAARITELTGPSSITAEDLDAPAPPEDGVVIDVRAAGVCFPDVLLSRGEYQMKPDPPFTPGCEVAGVVTSVGPKSRYAVGDRVAAFPFLGGFAEQVACADALTFALPDSVGFEAGAALPMNYFTVHFALVTRGGLRAGESVLVHGAAGGIGTAAVQLAKALGATVYAVVSDDAKAAVALEAGADETILADGFLSRVKELTGGRGVDVVVDPVGGDRFTDSLRSLATLGRLLVIGFTAGSIPEVKVNRLLLNNVSVVGVGWGAYWMSRPEFLARQWEDLLPLLNAGALTPVIGQTFTLEQTAEAIALLEERRATGKVLVLPRTQTVE